MTTERKIETIDVIKQMVADGQISQDVAEKYFPELKESEEDRIRKKVIDVLKLNVRGAETQMQANRGTDRTFEVYACNKVIAWLEKQGNIDSHVKLPTFTFDDILALQCCMKTATANEYKELYVQLKSLHDRVYDAYWLEKQGEKKPTEVESKFKVGDWVINKHGIVHQIANVIENVTYHTYGYDIVGGGYFNDNTEGVRLWTIEDAKDGDVLVYDNGCVEIILLFKKWCREVGFGAYNYAHITSSGHNIYINDWSDCGSSARPATKLERDTLMEAMADAGYTFDFGKKELRKNLKE